MLNKTQEELVKELFKSTDLTIQKIADQLDVKFHDVWYCIKSSFSKEERDNRKRENYRKSRIGSLNPSYGKYRENSHRWKGGIVEDGNGYLMIYKPEWYTGRKGSKHIFQHTAVICEALGLTELPATWVVHHIDGNKKNNNLNNLALLTNSAHTRLHVFGRCNDYPEKE